MRLKLPVRGLEGERIQESRPKSKPFIGTELIWNLWFFQFNAVTPEYWSSGSSCPQLRPTQVRLIQDELSKLERRLPVTIFVNSASRFQMGRLQTLGYQFSNRLSHRHWSNPCTRLLRAENLEAFQGKCSRQSLDIHIRQRRVLRRRSSNVPN